MPTPQDVKRFENILKAAGFEIDDSEIGRLVQGDVDRSTMDRLLAAGTLEHLSQIVQ